jgi:hypothetical protein
VDCDWLLIRDPRTKHAETRLIEQQVEEVVMESTAQYWRPVFCRNVALRVSTPLSNLFAGNPLVRTVAISAT